MQIKKLAEGGTLTYTLDGRLDTTTAPELESDLKISLDDVAHLVFDFTDLAYISSSGLRVLLAAQKVMSRQGDMIVKNVNESIMEVFEITGFSDLLTIQ